MKPRVLSSPWVMVRAGSKRVRSMGPKCSRASHQPCQKRSQNVHQFQKQMTADDRGVRPRARLTGRAGGLERLDLGFFWGGWKLRGAMRLVLRPRPGCEIHSKGSIARTRTRALTRAPHTAFMCVCKTEQPLLTLVEGHADACWRSGP